MNLGELRAELDGGGIRPAYLLAGEEPLLRDDALHALEAAVLEGGADDFNLDRFSGADVTPARLVDSVRTLPVMAPRRLVVLRDPEARRGAAAQLGEAIAAARRQGARHPGGEPVGRLLRGAWRARRTGRRPRAPTW